MSLVRRLFYKQRKFYDDDFDWENYTDDSYARRLHGDVEGEFTAKADEGALSFDPATGIVASKGAPLHPNHALILEVIGKLRPASVHEAGCGGGDHLGNGMSLFPEVQFTGGDRGQTQLSLALERHPGLAGKVGLQDITMPYSDAWPKAELVYTQAVLMHIHTAVSHLVALANVLRQSTRFALLVENFQCHNFVSEILALHKGGHLDGDLHLYLVEREGARGILASREPLDWTPLTDDTQLRAGQKRSDRRLNRANDDTDRATFGFAAP